MTPDQATVFGIVLGALVLFIWGRWRYDVVAFVALVAAVLLGVVPFSQAFLGFGHPATVTVAAVLVISRALQNSGGIDLLAQHLMVSAASPIVRISVLTGLAAALSAFMNNIGALALLMPLALQTAQSPARVLMPLSFGSILGGLMTLIGTPPNIIIANYRETVAGTPFGFFDFSPVGAPVALAGVLFVTLVGWRLIPQERLRKKAPEEVFEIKEYVTEVRVPEGSRVIGQPLRELEDLIDDEVVAVGIIRGNRRLLGNRRSEPLQGGDVVILQIDPASLDQFQEATDLEIARGADAAQDLRSDEVDLIEAVVVPGSRIEGRSSRNLRLRSAYGVHLLALARQGRPLRKRLSRLRFRAGDVLLLQGEVKSLPETVAALGCLPLARRALQLGRRRQVALPFGIFAAALALTASGLLPVHVAFSAAVAGLVVLDLVAVREIYESIDWPVIVLLGGMIPLGGALEATGGTGLIASTIVGLAEQAGPTVLLVLLMIVTMTLSDVMNNAATAVVMAPIAAGIAAQLDLSPDPFLMATAVGASCAFLTPIGHQNNILIMSPGGYRFGDYWRMGLPLEILIVLISVPLILYVWPLSP